MILEWGLILSVTSVSVTMLMIIGTYLAIFPQAKRFYSVGQSAIVLLASIFNIGYIFITPFVFNLFNKHYVTGVLISTVATGVAAIGRYLAGENYTMSFIMTAIVAVAHIPIITAPYGLLKLFPDWQKGYAASIPLFLPVLGINFCILYGMEYIAGKQESEAKQQIYGLNGIIAIVGVIACSATIILTLLMKSKIQKQQASVPVQLHEEPSMTTTENENLDKMQKVDVKLQEETDNFCGKICSDLCQLTTTLFSQKRTATILICWGIIVGINWTYGSLFGIIFDGQNLSGKQIAMLGLAANLSSAIFSNLGTFLKNKFNLDNMTVIENLNIFGIAAAIIIELSRMLPILQNLYFLIFLIIVLRAGFSSFVSLSFIEMQKDGMKSLIVSGFFFWIANVSNFITMTLVDMTNTDLSLFLLSLFVIMCVVTVNKYEQMCSTKI